MKLRTLPILPLVAAIMLLPARTAAQDGPRWQRSQAPTEAPLAVFQSTQAVNLPTAETIGAGEWLFEIAHRFQGTIDGGWDTFWGMDGGARMRIALHWAPVSNLMVGVSRSNLDDNLDLGLKARLFAADGALPVVVALTGGVAWNTQVPGAPDDAETTQLRAAAVIDLGLGDRVGVGIVPEVVVNPDVRAADEDASVTLGTHGRVELNDRVSLIGEWVFGSGTGSLDHDAGSFGIELETGGHFFKIVAGNSIRLNPTQAGVGSGSPFGTRQLRLGFNITRLIRF